MKGALDFFLHCPQAYSKEYGGIYDFGDVDEISKYAFSALSHDIEGPGMSQNFKWFGSIELTRLTSE